MIHYESVDSPNQSISKADQESVTMCRVNEEHMRPDPLSDIEYEYPLEYYTNMPIYYRSEERFSRPLKGMFSHEPEYSNNRQSPSDSEYFYTKSELVGFRTIT